MEERAPTGCYMAGGDGLSTLPNNKIKFAYISTKTNFLKKKKQNKTMLI